MNKIASINVDYSIILIKNYSYLLLTSMANTKPRVIIPRNPALKLKLAAQIYAKHLDMANESPLNAIQSNPWSATGPEIVNAQTLHQQAEEYERKSELAYQQRDLLLAKIDESIKSSRDLLLGVHRKIPKSLGQWGFEVDDSPKASKKTKE